MPPSPTNADIFVVDDNKLVRAGMVFLLERENYVVKEFHDPEPLINELFSTPSLPRLIISDYEMRGMNGLDIINKLKESSAHQHIPVLIISAQNSTTLQYVAEKAGAVGWVKKTKMIDDLVPAVQKYIL